MNTMEQMPNEENMNQQQRRARPPPPEPPALYCPRCRSFNIKFCYYNNYSLSQPRYFCKDCKRYWTHGGTLRDIPIGGGGRRGKRGRTLAAPSSLASDLARTTPTFSITSLPPQNQPGVIPNQFPRAFPPVMPPVINSFTENGARFSSLMMQSPAGINQGTTVRLGVQGGHLGPNMALLQRLTHPYLVPQVPQPSQLQSNFYSSQQSMVLPRLGTSWTQSLMNSTVANSFGAGPSFQSSDQASSSYNPNHQCSADRLPGFGPPQP